MQYAFVLTSSLQDTKSYYNECNILDIGQPSEDGRSDTAAGCFHTVFDSNRMIFPSRGPSRGFLKCVWRIMEFIHIHYAYPQIMKLYQWSFQEPIDWRCLPYIMPMQGLWFREYPPKIWSHPVQYLHFRILKLPLTIPDWWFGTCLLFSHILGIIIPTG